ncbi:hypothetical protein KC19_1G252000 [Ceratodon purpureus]|uniref:Uncharacterized protein n=1 Tax=Ceratodon purpureus TaxID=3225 RepID=A0A8T0JCK8_CERPU|nr:hypothetical protein KC19_1G251700 [Ceratodon purpureus]KAG0592441.1 hypothetical protein KC19_1G252000 [Ceratodon purpureus]
MNMHLFWLLFTTVLRDCRSPGLFFLNTAFKFILCMVEAGAGANDSQLQVHFLMIV